MALINNTLASNFAGMVLTANGSIVSGDSVSGVDGRLEIVGGVAQATLYPTDAETGPGGRIRSEIVWPYNSVGEFWYSWEFLIHEHEWQIPTADPIAVMSIHDVADGGDSARHPNLGVRVVAGQLRIEVPSATLPTESTDANRIATVPFEFGVWHKCVLHANWQIDATGFREFFFDGVPILRQFNLPTHYDDVAGPYAKVGVYDHSNIRNYTRLRAYFRNCFSLAGMQTYASVLGNVPMQPVRRLQIA